MNKSHFNPYTFLFLLISLCTACSEESLEDSSFTNQRKSTYKTEKVIIVVIDGPRFVDTWGHPEQKYIPRMAKELLPRGTFFLNFRNEGVTKTIAGHTAITTGNYQEISNNGEEYPQEPSLFQYYLQHTKHAPDQAFIVTSKLKLNILSDTRKLEWRGRYLPSKDCGKENKDRPDKETLKKAIQILQEKQPELLLIQFLGPDVKGHQNKWKEYLYSLQETDSLVASLWNFIQHDQHYQDKTALFITNDHGRHANNHKDGFISHGDNCEDCQKVSLLALGPDFSQGKVISQKYSLPDIAPTVAQLLGFPFTARDGQPIEPLLHHTP